MKLRTKPVIVEAVAVRDVLDDKPLPQWMVAALQLRDVRRAAKDDSALVITSNDEMEYARENDFVVRYPSDELHACTAQDLADDFDPIDDAQLVNDGAHEAPRG